MNKTYINKVKHKIFPEIKDWSDPQDKIRNTWDINKLSQKEWFWMHPSAYKLILYGSPIITIIIMAALALALIMNGLGIIAIIPSLIIGVSTYDLVKKVQNKGLHKNKTMYDTYMRE